MTDWLSLLAEQRRQEAEQLRAQQQEALMGMTQEPQLDMGQKLVTGLGALAPLIAGIIRGGKTGLQTGAALGMGVLQDIDRRRQDDMKFNTAIAKNKYDSATKSAEKAENQADKAEFEKAKLKEREARGDLAKHGAAQINLPANEQSIKIPVGAAAEAARGVGSVAIMKAALFELENELQVDPELQKKYKREDGSIDWNSGLDILGRSVETALLGSDEGARGRAVAAMQAAVNNIINARSGLASTQQEADRVMTEMGKGILPKSIPGMIEDLKRIIAKTEFVTTQRVAANDALQRYRSGGGHVSALEQLFEDQTGQAAKRFGPQGASLLAQDILGGLGKEPSDTPTPASPDLASTIYGDVKGLFRGGDTSVGSSAGDVARANLRKKFGGQ